MANESEIFKIILKRGTTAKAQVYTGDAGEVVVDTGLKTLRVQDGVTLGGVLLAKSDHLHSFSTLENKPTTLGDYGITDAAPSSHIGATGAAHGVATTSVAGFMSATDKSKLDGITAGANAYTHPTSGAATGTYRSVTVDANGHVTAGTNPTTLSGYGITDAAPSSHVGATGAAHGVATTSVAGFMSATDKSKLDGVASGANNYAHPTSGVTAGTYRSVTVDANGHVTAGTNPTTLSGYGISDAVASSDVVTVASANKLLKLDSTGKLPASVTGSAATLQTARTINGISFDGSANITINATDSVARIASSEKGAANGVATLDGTGKVPTSQLPSFVDDVLESPSFANLPTSGVTGVLYLTVDTNRVYRWSGSAYVEISAGAGTADSAMKLSTARSIGMTGDVTWSIPSFDGSANVTAVGTLANSGVTAGTYHSVTVDAKGHVTAGTNPTTLTGYGITDAAPSSHVGATGAAHGVATTSVAGFMSATDKSKLDGVASGANNYTHPISGATADTYRSVTVDANGHVTAGTNPTTLSGYGITDAAPSSHVGATGAAHGVATSSVDGFMSAADKSKLDGVATGANNYAHPASGVAASTYRSVTVDANGHVTAGTNPTTLSGYGITDAQPLHGDLTALAGLSTTGLVVRTASGAAATRALSVSGTGLSLTNGDGVAGNLVITSNATSSNTASAVVARDASGGFSAGAVTVSGLGLSGTGGRITGNFSGAVFADRTLFQTSTANTATTLGSVPNGSGVGSSYVAFDKADPANAAYLQLFVGSDVSSAGIRSGASGSGTPLPLKFLTGTGGVERVVIDAEGATAFKGGVFESKVALTAAAIDLKTGNMFTKTVTAATTLSVVNTPASGAMASFILELTNGGAYAVTWWTGAGGATVKWAGGTAPSLTAAGRDVLGFYTHDGGVTWNGLVLGKDLK